MFPTFNWFALLALLMGMIRGMMTTGDILVPDHLWHAIQPLLPTPPPRYGGRPRVDDRAALAGIVYQLRTGVPSRLLPTREFGVGARSPAGGGCATGNAPGCGSACTTGCWMSLAARPARLVPRQRGLAERARQTGGTLTGPNPTDRGKPRSKYHLLVDATVIRLAVGLSGANTHDSMLLEAVVDAVPPIRGPRGRPGRPRKRPAKLHGDNGYDYPRCRRALRRRGITPRIARRGIESSERLGCHRYVVERSLAWLVGCRWLQVRYERHADILLGFVSLACALICLNLLNRPRGGRQRLLA